MRSCRGRGGGSVGTGMRAIGWMGLARAAAARRVAGEQLIPPTSRTILKEFQLHRWVMISRMTWSVYCMPRLAKMPTLAMVLSTPLVMIPSPPRNSR